MQRKAPKRSTRKLSPVALQEPDLSTRTSWVDAGLAYKLVKKGKAKGSKCALLLRHSLQRYLFRLGCFQQRYCLKVLIIGLLVLGLLTVGLKSAIIEAQVEKLWVEEGGRLTSELEYTDTVLGKGHGSSSLIIVQTPTSESQDIRNVLTRESLSLHLDAVLRATDTNVYLFNKVWKFEDICMKASFPSFENYLIDQMLERLVPCLIISPLDCFWEGSKALGPKNPLVLPSNFGLDPISWRNLDPTSIITAIEDIIGIKLDYIREMLRGAGISTGYQEKPCLNPFDEECPVTAQNYRQHFDESASLADLLDGGCYGFSPAHMHWVEDMIIGGVTKNRSNVLTSAKAIQTIIQLKGSRDLYEYYKGTYTVNSIDWTEEKAVQILEVFEKKFTQVITSRNEEITDSLSCFTQASLSDLVESFSHASYLNILIGYGLMLVYAVLMLMNLSDPVKSHVMVGICGVLLATLCVASGLGVCALLQLPFNAATTQIVPFLALGLGVDDVFLMALGFAENTAHNFIKFEHQAGELLKRTGSTVLLTSLSNISVFLLAAVVPIPALRFFSLQVAILLMMNLVAILFIYPALISLDALRKKHYKIDVLCCVDAARRKVEDISRANIHSAEHQQYSRAFAPVPSTPVPSAPVPSTRVPCDVSGGDGYLNNQGIEKETTLTREDPILHTAKQQAPPDCSRKGLQRSCSLTWLVENHYIPLINKTWYKMLIFIASLSLLAISIYGIFQVQDGLNLLEIVPEDTNVYTFVETQEKYFGFYDMYIITKDMQYQLKENQKNVRLLYKRISQLPEVIKNEDGTSSAHPLWLDLMVSWLKDLQSAYDVAVSMGMFGPSGWYTNATEDAILAYTLLVQTGNTDEPVDLSRASYTRLVDDEGFIDSDGFYNYLTAWRYNDLLAYETSQANIQPTGNEWYYVPYDKNLVIPKAPDITLARMFFYLHSLNDNERIVATIQHIRSICETFEEEHNIPNYPYGVVFTFWEQYINIRFYLLISLLAALSTVFLMITFLLMNPLAAFLVVFILTLTTAELFGVMGLLGIHLSAVPVVILIASVGIGVEFTVHIIIGFITSVGPRSVRVARSLSHMFAPVLHGATSTLLSIIMLAASDFGFIVRYFFLSLLSLVLLGIFNGLVFFPVLLSICGPSGELQSEDPNAHCIQLPTPEPSPPSSPELKEKKNKYYSKKRNISQNTLNTISEEASNESYYETPTVRVETTITPGRVNVRGENSITRVTTQSTVTVELHNTNNDPRNTLAAAVSSHDSTSSVQCTDDSATDAVTVL